EQPCSTARLLGGAAECASAPRCPAVSCVAPRGGYPVALPRISATAAGAAAQRRSGAAACTAAVAHCWRAASRSSAADWGQSLCSVWGGSNCSQALNSSVASETRKWRECGSCGCMVGWKATGKVGETAHFTMTSICIDAFDEIEDNMWSIRCDALMPYDQVPITFEQWAIFGNVPRMLGAELQRSDVLENGEHPMECDMHPRLAPPTAPASIVPATEDEMNAMLSDELAPQVSGAPSDDIEDTDVYSITAGGPQAPSAASEPGDGATLGAARPRASSIRSEKLEGKIAEGRPIAQPLNWEKIRAQSSYHEGDALCPVLFRTSCEAQKGCERQDVRKCLRQEKPTHLGQMLQEQTLYGDCVDKLPYFRQEAMSKWLSGCCLHGPCRGEPPFGIVGPFGSIDENDQVVLAQLDDSEDRVAPAYPCGFNAGDSDEPLEQFAIAEPRALAPKAPTESASTLDAAGQGDLREPGGGQAERPYDAPTPADITALAPEGRIPFVGILQQRDPSAAAAAMTAAAFWGGGRGCQRGDGGAWQCAADARRQFIEQQRRRTTEDLKALELTARNGYTWRTPAKMAAPLVVDVNFRACHLPDNAFARGAEVWRLQGKHQSHGMCRALYEKCLDIVDTVAFVRDVQDSVLDMIGGQGCSATAEWNKSWCCAKGGSNCNQALSPSMECETRRWRECGSCNRMTDWTEDGDADDVMWSHEDCRGMGDWDHSWCYVQGGFEWRDYGSCDFMSEWNYDGFSVDGKARKWRERGSCKRMTDWNEHGDADGVVESSVGCSATADWDQNRCYAKGSFNCNQCKLGCIATADWDQGQRHDCDDCSAAADWYQRWCYVQGGSTCDQSRDSSGASEKRKCCERCSCNCMTGWDYDGDADGVAESLEGCSATADWDQSWCYVHGGSNCDRAQESSVAGATQKWCECGSCNCMTGRNYD
ncbi:unnamed protein product, partial [Prorocentrum cordatum]